MPSYEKKHLIKHGIKNEATNLILSESVSSLLSCLQKMVADWMRDDVKTEALAENRSGAAML